MNDQQLTILRGLIEADAGLLADMRAGSYGAVAAALNTRTWVDNPAPQQDVPKQWTMIQIFGAIQPDEALAIYRVPQLKSDIHEAVNNNDRVAMAAFFQMVAANGLLGQQSMATVQALLQVTEPDPNWSATVPGPSPASSAGLPAVTAIDVQMVANR